MLPPDESGPNKKYKSLLIANLCKFTGLKIKKGTSHLGIYILRWSKGNNIFSQNHFHKVIKHLIPG